MFGPAGFVLTMGEGWPATTLTDTIHLATIIMKVIIDVLLVLTYKCMGMYSQLHLCRIMTIGDIFLPVIFQRGENWAGLPPIIATIKGKPNRAARRTEEGVPPAAIHMGRFSERGKTVWLIIGVEDYLSK